MKQKRLQNEKRFIFIAVAGILQKVSGNGILGISGPALGAGSAEIRILTAESFQNLLDVTRLLLFHIVTIISSLVSKACYSE